MRKIFILVAMLSIMLLSFGTAQAAKSAIDNLPGGASIAYFQAGGGWQTLLNVQNVATAARNIHVTIWDGNSVHLFDFNMCLTARDNVGIVFTGGSSAGQVRITDYSDSVGGYNTVPADGGATYVTVTSGTTTSAGVAYGYATIAVAASTTGGSGCGGGTNYGAPGTVVVLPDSIFVRQAILTTTEAFATNAAMLQGFVNMGNVADGTTAAAAPGFYRNTPAAQWQECTNLDGNTAISTTYTGLDDVGAVGVNISFLELLITRNGATTAANAIHVSGNPDACVFYNALGSGTGNYWGRYNMNSAAGTNTNFITVAPDRSRAPATSRWGHWGAAQLVYNDDEIWNSSGPICTAEVCFVPVGVAANNLNPGVSTAGEALIYIPYPIFGFSYTYAASYADLYPLVKENANVFVPANGAVSAGVGVASASVAGAGAAGGMIQIP